MVNLSQGIDKLLAGQEKISLQIKQVRKLQQQQLVGTLDAFGTYESNTNGTARHCGNIGESKTSRGAEPVYGSDAANAGRSEPNLQRAGKTSLRP